MDDRRDEARGEDEAQVGEVIYSPGTDDPGPDITAEEASRQQTPREPGTRHVTFGGDQEAKQAQELGDQMTRSITHQLETASEHVQHISWIETDGSRANARENPNDLQITRFELILSNGKVYTLDGPLINLKIQN